MFVWSPKPKNRQNCYMLALCYRIATEVPMAISKSEVISVRVEPPIKEALQVAASLEMRSLANMVEVMVVSYCRSQGYPLTGIPNDALPATLTRGSRVE